MFQEGYLPNVCRTCNNEKANLFKIFEDKLLGDTTKIDKMLKAICPIEIYNGDPYPNQICQNCAKKLEVTYKFLNKYKKAQREINKLLRYARNLNLNQKNQVTSTSFYSAEFVEVKSECYDNLTLRKTHEDTAIQASHASKLKLNWNSLKKPFHISQQHNKDEQDELKEITANTTDFKLKIEGMHEAQEERKDHLPSVLDGETMGKVEYCESKFHCTICKKSFLSIKALSLHNKIVHKSLLNNSSKIPTFTTQSNDCNEFHIQTIFDDRILKNQSKSMTNVRCKICNKAFQTNKALNLHEKIAHKQ